MLAAKRSADVAPEVNLRIPLHTGYKACKQRDPDITRDPPFGVMHPQWRIQGGASDPSYKLWILHCIFIVFGEFTISGTPIHLSVTGTNVF